MKTRNLIAVALAFGLAGPGIPAAMAQDDARTKPVFDVGLGIGEVLKAAKVQGKALIIVLDNGGYGTERKLHAGEWKFNDIHPWQYHRLPEIYGGGTGFDISTEADFDKALSQAWEDRSGPSILHVRIGIDDHSPPLIRLGERLGARI